MFVIVCNCMQLYFRHCNDIRLNRCLKVQEASPATSHLKDHFAALAGGKWTHAAECFSVSPWRNLSHMALSNGLAARLCHVHLVGYYDGVTNKLSNSGYAIIWQVFASLLG